MATVQMPQSTFSDILDEVDMKPWWERLRGYCSFGIITSCFVIVQISTLFYTVDCIPVNATTEYDHLKMRASYINNICSNQLNIGKFRTPAVVDAVSLLILTNWWTLLPSVVSLFRSYRKVEDMLDEVLLSIDKFDDAENAAQDKKYWTKLNEIRQLAKNIESSKDTPHLYFFRFLLLMCYTVMSIYIYLIFKLDDNDYSFDCTLNDISNSSYHDVLKSLANVTNYSCSHDLTRKLKPYYYTILILAVTQTIVSWFSLIALVRGGHFWNVVPFLDIFWQNARPVGEGHFRKYADILLSEEFTVAKFLDLNKDEVTEDSE